MDNRRIDFLAKKWQTNTLTEAERHEFEQWYNAFDDATHQLSGYKNAKELADKIYGKIEQNVKPSQPYRSSLWPKLAVACVFLLLISSALIYFARTTKQTGNKLSIIKYDALPGNNHAILILGNGNQITLGINDKKLITNPDGQQIEADKGKLVYGRTNSHAAFNEVSYNTIITPAGGQYQVTLPDGSQVWLNAKTSLKYPVSFNGNERRVELSGEAYFEITHNAKQPFIVSTRGESVRVLGTHFNVSAYTDEQQVTTTLLQGSIQVATAQTHTLIKPGEQAILNVGDKRAGFIVQSVNTDQAVAWKNGLFYFKTADIPTVMRTLARWYNLQVEFEGKMSAKTFSGKIYRNVNASNVVQILKYSGINAQLQKPTNSSAQAKIIVKL